MTEEGYEVMGPTGGGTPAAPNPVIPAFPVSKSGPEKPQADSGGIPQFPVAGSNAIPPPPPAANSGMDNKEAGFVDDKESVMKSTAGTAGKGGEMSKAKGGGGKKKKKTKSKSQIEDVEESRMDAPSSSGATNRPNTLDTCQLAMVIFFVVIAVGIATPVLLTAMGSADIEYVKKNLQKL